MGKYVDLTGKRFERLEVLKRSNKTDSSQNVYWECICDCGNVIVTAGCRLKGGTAKSCGCLKLEVGRNREKRDRIGETRIMNNGLSATIIAYRGNKDIDVLFENGEIAKSRHYRNFIQGGIDFSKVRIGESKLMNNGLCATIIEYRGRNDLDIQFENGEIHKHKQYNCFQKGEIKCPMLFEYIDDYVKVTNPNVTPAFSFLIDREDIGIIGHSLWFSGNSGYAIGRINNRMKSLHRLIMNAPDNMQVDHINCDRADNRKHNLRLCTHAENQFNRPNRATNTSGIKGVGLHKLSGKWRAYIGANGKYIHLGYFANKKEAALAYNEAAVELHGEFARLNNI